jgi:hypothetical protein
LYPKTRHIRQRALIDSASRADFFAVTPRPAARA